MINISTGMEMEFIATQAPVKLVQLVSCTIHHRELNIFHLIRYTQPIENIFQWEWRGIGMVVPVKLVQLVFRLHMHSTVTSVHTQRGCVGRLDNGKSLVASSYIQTEHSTTVLLLTL